tara:strand:+ start:10086 stop:11966 length:1881 start_codon:yes stop_codon:yes gene_type:complete
LKKPNLHTATFRGLPVFTLPAFNPAQAKIYGATLLKKKRIFVYPAWAPFHEKVLDDYAAAFPNGTISAEAENAAAVQNDVKAKIATRDMDGYTPAVGNYDHQEEAFVNALWNYRYGLFLGRGLGKTKVVVDLVRHFKKKDPNFRCLVLALRVNLYTWQAEAEKFSGGDVRAMPLVATSPKQRIKRLKEILAEDPEMLVITYDTARVAHELILENFKYGMIVADESHKLRGYKSGQTKASHALASVAARRLLLTGTASLGDPRHLWGQLRFLGKFIVPNFWHFKERYVRVAPYNKHVVVGFKNMHLLNRKVSELSMSREAHECLDLPERIFQNIPIDPTKTQLRAYNDLIVDGTTTIQDQILDAPERIVQLGKLAQICSGFVYKSRKDPNICDSCPQMAACVRSEISPYTKACSVVQKNPGNDVLHLAGGNPVLDTATALVEEHLEEGSKLIVWARHRETLRLLYTRLSETCTSHDKSFYALRYDSTAKDPSEVEQQFNTDPNAKVLVAQISMGIGVTFNAPVMIYAELDWALDAWLQSQDRNFGIRAKGHKRLLVQTIVIRNSITHSIHKLLSNKIDVASMLTRAPECVTCDYSLTCFSKGTKPYTPGCKWEKTASKTIITTPLLR